MNVMAQVDTETRRTSNYKHEIILLIEDKPYFWLIFSAIFINVPSCSLNISPTIHEYTVIKLTAVKIMNVIINKIMFLGFNTVNR